MSLGDIAVSVLTADDLAIRESIFVAVLKILFNVSTRRAKHIDVDREPTGLATQNKQKAGSALERQRTSLFDKHFQKREGTDDLLNQFWVFELM